jgi:hypothetical protein
MSTEEFVEAAIARARWVLPVPGGPCRRIPRGGFRPESRFDEKLSQKMERIEHGSGGTHQNDGRGPAALKEFPIGREFGQFVCPNRLWMYRRQGL